MTKLVAVQVLVFSETVIGGYFLKNNWILKI